MDSCAFADLYVDRQHESKSGCTCDRQRVTSRDTSLSSLVGETKQIEEERGGSQTRSEPRRDDAANVREHHKKESRRNSPFDLTAMDHAQVIAMPFGAAQRRLHKGLLGTLNQTTNGVQSVIISCRI